MNKTARANATWSHPITFFGLALGWSWLFWGSAIVLGLGFETELGIGLGLLGLLGPMVAGIVSTRLAYGKAGMRDYWQRVTDFRRIGLKWYAVIFLLVPILVGLAALIDRFIGNSGVHWGEPAVAFFAAPWTIIGFAVTTFLIGPMEEFGWRGYALDRLQERWNAVTASLILGVVWSLWHLPLFFIPDTYQHGLGAGSPAFWQFMLGIVPLNLVFTWVYNNTGRSTLAVMLLHFMVNFSAEFVELPQRADLIWILLWTLTAIGLTLMYGAKNLRRQPRRIADVPG